MRWFNLAVTPKFPWPRVQVRIPFEGYEVVLQPHEYGSQDQAEIACAVSVFHPDGISFDIGGTIACKFLSRLAWSQDEGIIELFAIGTNHPDQPGRLGQGSYERSGWMAVEPWNNIYLPAAATPETDLALALYREGMSLNSAPFAFLSFFKVLNILFKSGEDQKRWLNNHFQKVWFRPAKERLVELEETEQDIGAYLYHQGRCAVAHAHGYPLVNPDSFADKRRLEHDVILMKELAAIFIEHELEILTENSFLNQLRMNPGANPELLIRNQSEDGQIIYIPQPQFAYAPQRSEDHFT